MSSVVGMGMMLTQKCTHACIGGTCNASNIIQKINRTIKLMDGVCSVCVGLVKIYCFLF